METQVNPGANSGRAGGRAKDFFINLGAIVALYTSIGSLIDLLFTIINTAYPQVGYGYSYFGSESISWSVATLIVFFPVFLLLMWLLEQDYKVYPEKQSAGIHKWLTYLTLFLSGLIIAIDLITVLYYFLDGQELTTGFILKVLVLLIIAASVFAYYLHDVLGKLTAKSRVGWRLFSGAFILGSIVWGFVVLGSPHTQRLYKYDEQKINDLISLHSEITNYYNTKGALPRDLADLTAVSYYLNVTDSQSKKPYEYEKTGDTTYNLCAEFNKDSKEKDNANSVAMYPYGASWTHPAGQHCFSQTVNPDIYSKPFPVR